MKARKPLTNEEGEVRELTAEDFKYFRPMAEGLSPSLAAKLGIKPRGPQKMPTKERTTIRLSRDVLDRFRATGRGWQTRVDDALREWLESHPAE
ncbi:MAG: BrnA antitoxin family protein [Alphaproteobacteria bacterium]|nr:BrnA antitoxin family protein [Alphaproteobacteria bacterium]MBV9552319.1 BrnA antitoxin family protein [Alphaproteobacteria bacterium]